MLRKKVLERPVPARLSEHENLSHPIEELTELEPLIDLVTTMLDVARSEHLVRAYRYHRTIVFSGNERRIHALYAHPIGIAAEHERHRGDSARPITLGRPGATSLTSTSRPATRIAPAIACESSLSSAPLGVNKGLTESIATSSRKSLMLGYCIDLDNSVKSWDS